MNTTVQDLLPGQAEAVQLDEIVKPGISPATMKGLVFLYYPEQRLVTKVLA